MKKPYDEFDGDDGHTIADMSQVPGMTGQLFGRRPPQKTGGSPAAPPRPQEAGEFTRMERLMAVLGALKATLLIALVYIVGLGAVILLMLLFWK